MSCKKLRIKARWEQDRWLSYLPVRGDPNIFEDTVIRRIPTDRERIDFLRFDSHGGDIPAGNIILAGKLAARAVGDDGWVPCADELKMIMMAPYEKWAWPGGLEIIEDYLWRVCGLGPLRTQFGDEIVRTWLAAFLWHAFGWPDLVARERHAGFHSG